MIERFLENATADKITRQLECSHVWQLVQRNPLPITPPPDAQYDAECYHCELTAIMRYAPQWENPFTRPFPECRFMGPADGSILRCNSGYHLARFTVG